MTAKEAIEILKEEHDYAQLPSYVNQALGMAITALEENEIYKQVNLQIASQRDERNKTIEELEEELEKLTDKLRVARIAAYMDFIEKMTSSPASSGGFLKGLWRPQENRGGGFCFIDNRSAQCVLSLTSSPQT